MFVKSTIVKIGALSVLLSLILAACADPATPTTPAVVPVTSQPATSAPQVLTPGEGGGRPASHSNRRCAGPDRGGLAHPGGGGRQRYLARPVRPACRGEASRSAESGSRSA